MYGPPYVEQRLQELAVGVDEPLVLSKQEVKDDPKPHRVERQESSAATAGLGKRNRYDGFRRTSSHTGSAARRAQQGDRNSTEERGSNTWRADRRARTG